MTETFKVGDKATALGQRQVTITYGPFMSTFDRHEMYVAADGAGRERSYQTTDLKALPAFAVGDMVKYEYGGGGKLVAGPFKSGYHSEAIWVVEKADGTHMTPTQNSLTKVAPADEPPANTYTHNGVTYDLDARYRDRDGDMFEFSTVQRSTAATEDGNDDGTPLGRITGGRWVWSLAEAARRYGPLTRVND